MNECEQNMNGHSRIPESRSIQEDISMRLFIAGFTPSTTERDLRPLFEEFGEVIDLVVMKDRNSGQSRCFGFAEMDDASGAKAMHGLDGMRMSGRKLAVTVAQPRPGGRRG